MSASRVFLVITALVLGSQSASIGQSEGVEEFEKKLIQLFNEKKWESTVDYVDEPGSMILFDNYLEIKEANLITNPDYKASSLKLDMDKNIIQMTIALGTIDMRFQALLVNRTLEVPTAEFADARINITDLTLIGNVTIAVEDNHFVPHIYDIDFTDKGGVLVNTETDGSGKSLDIVTTTSFEENVNEAFQIMTKPIFHQFQEDVNKILKTCLKKISVDTIFKSGEELEKYRSKVSLATEKANKIIDDVCNMTVFTGIFEDPIHDNDGYSLPQYTNGKLTADGITVADGTMQFGFIKRHGDFNSYDDGKNRYISGYISLDRMTLLNNYTTKYEETPVTGTMKTIANNAILLMELAFEKGSCDGIAQLRVAKFGDVDTSVTPGNVRMLLHWQEEDLRRPLVGRIRISMLTTALKYLVSGIQLGYSATPCES